MEFITVEQFKEQPKEVQKVFLDWWKPSKFDLYSSDGFHTYLVGIEEEGLICPNVSSMVWHEKEKCTPLFTEGQLRKFIEYKINSHSILGISDCKKYVITLIKNDDELYEIIDTKETNLLQAYWKVACMVAKEGLNEI